MVATAAWRRSEGLEVQPSSLHSHFVHISEQNADDFVVMPDPGTGAHLFAASSFRGLLEAVTLEAETSVQRAEPGQGRFGEERSPPSADAVPGASAAAAPSPASPDFCVPRTGKGQHRQTLGQVLDRGILSQRCSMVTASIRTLGHLTHTLIGHLFTTRHWGKKRLRGTVKVRNHVRRLKTSRVVQCGGH